MLSISTFISLFLFLFQAKDFKASRSYSDLSVTAFTGINKTTETVSYKHARSHIHQTHDKGEFNVTY
jgi:hypothetical protein